MFKKHMTPLSKGGALHAHKGKGSQMAGMPNRSMVGGMSAPGSTMNNYTKASPMPQGVAPDDGDAMPMPMPPGLGG